MATSSCPKCGNTSFEAKLNSPTNSNFKVQFIQCDSCGCVVGTNEYFNGGYLVKKLAIALNIDLDTIHLD